MKKIFTLISMALMAIGVNAQTTIYSWESPEGTAVETGGTAVGNGADEASVNYASSSYYTIRLSSKKANIADDNVTITLTQALAAGDEISFTAFIKKDESREASAYILFADGVDAETENFGDNENIGLSGAIGTKTVAVPEAAAGVTTIKLARGKSGTNLFITKLTITRAGGGGGSTEAEKWTAGSLDLTTVTSAANTTATLKKVEKVYNIEGGAQPDEATVRADATTALVLNDYTFTGSTTNVTLTGVSTPNTGTAEAEIWKFAGADNVKLNATNLSDECLVEFDNQYVLAGNGNPGLEAYEYFFTNSDGDPIGPRYYETYWTDGCGSAPLKGCYYKFDSKAAGNLVIGFFLNKNLASNPLYIVDAATNTRLASSAIKVKGFRQNCNFETEQGGTTKLTTFTLDDNGFIVIPDGIGGGTNRPLFGYISIDVTANSSYYLFSPKSQMGIYGFQFKGGTSGINIQNATNTWNANAPMYNLSGQKVDKSYKGIVIQNGRKFMNK